MTKILLVCMGNICRSPIAQGVLQHLATQGKLAHEIRIDSAGTHGTGRGEPPDPRAIRAAAARGYDISRLRSRVIGMGDYSEFDLILAMDRSNLAFLDDRCPPPLRTRLHLFLNYAGIALPDEVPDPYYGSAAGFDHVLDLCETAASGIIERIQQR